MSTKRTRTTNDGLAYRVEGSGVPLLLLHGIPGQADGWDDIVPLVVERGCRAIVPDLLGFGQSSNSGGVHLEDQADALAALLSSLEVREMFVIAHDFGVPVLLTLTRKYPEIRVKGLVAASTNLFPDTPIPPPLRLAKYSSLRWILWPMLGTVPGARMTFTMGSGKIRAGRYPLAKRSARSTFQIFARSLAGLAEIYSPIERAARALNAPTVVLWGTKDPFFSVATGKRTAEAFKAEFVLLDGVGHFVPEEAPHEMMSAFDRILNAVPTR